MEDENDSAAAAETPYSRPSPTASASDDSSKSGIIAILAAGHFAYRSTSSQQGAASHKRIRLSDFGSLGSDMGRGSSVFTSSLPRGDGIPPFLHRYRDLSTARELAVHKAAAAVRVAYESSYGDQIELWSHLMVAAVKDGQIPHQPQATPARVIQRIGETLTDDVSRLVGFAALLPGFPDLDADDQKLLLSAKYLISTMLHRAKFVYRGEIYTYLVGPEQIHCGQYWLLGIDIDQEFRRLWNRSAEMLNDVGLTLMGTYMLLAVAIFAPDHARAVEKTALGQLHAFYLDALFYMLGSRLTIAERALAYHKLEKMMEQFPMVDKISLNFISDLDLTSVPLRPRSITFLDSLRK